MNILVISIGILIFVLVFIFIIIIYFQNKFKIDFDRKFAEMNEGMKNSLTATAEQIKTANTSVTDGLMRSSDMLSQMNEKLGSLSEVTRQIQDVGKDMRSVQDLLKPPKMRGQIGELLLGKILEDSLPGGSYEFEYSFKSGERVDAVIKLKDGMVAIDSKFPMDMFRRYHDSYDEHIKKESRKEFVKAVKLQIDSISSKYIRVDEGTFNFALMYIPAENVYYEIIVKENDMSVDDYARSKNVIPVSPNSFYAYLETVILGLKGMQIEQRSKEIFEILKTFQKETSELQQEFEKLGGHLSNAGSCYDRVDKKIEKFSSKLVSIDKGGNVEKENN